MWCVVCAVLCHTWLCPSSVWLGLPSLSGSWSVHWPTFAGQGELATCGSCGVPVARVWTIWYQRVRMGEQGQRTCLAQRPAAHYVSVRAWCRNVSMLTEMSDRVAIMQGQGADCPFVPKRGLVDGSAHSVGQASEADICTGHLRNCVGYWTVLGRWCRGNLDSMRQLMRQILVAKLFRILQVKRFQSIP